MAKLTLSVDQKTVSKAKELAHDYGISVSGLFSQFIQSLSAKSPNSIRPGRIARQASGLVKMPPGQDDKTVLADALADKYRATK